MSLQSILRCITEKNIRKTHTIMSLLKSIKRLEYVNHLIKKRATGNLEALARKTGLSKRAMTDFLAQMKELGASIRYNRIKETYYYEEYGEISVSKFMKYGELLTRNEVAKIGQPEELCFSEEAIFVRCKDV